MRMPSPQQHPASEAQEAFLAKPSFQPRNVTLEKCSHVVYSALSGGRFCNGLFIVRVGFLISYKFPTNCCSTSLFIESVRIVYGAEAWAPVFVGCCPGDARV